MNKPILSSITNNLFRQVSLKSSNKSFIWSDSIRDNIEVISCKVGTKIEGSLTKVFLKIRISFLNFLEKGGNSDVSKIELFKDWQKVYELSKKLNSLNEFMNEKFKIVNDSINEITYNQAKSIANDYQIAKLEV